MQSEVWKDLQWLSVDSDNHGELSKVLSTLPDERNDIGVERMHNLSAVWADRIDVAARSVMI